MTVKRPGSTITSFFQKTKASKVADVKANTGDGSHGSFDKQKWIDSLTTEQKELLQLEIDTMDISWLAALHEELTKPYFLKLKSFLASEKKANKTIFPPEKDIYSWSYLTPIDKVSVICCGQDPYHNYNQAHGLAFSVNPPTRPPPSLVNIFKGIKKGYSDFQVPTSGLLTDWSKQGVLMLNACLTVEAHKANSHSNKGWEQFTERVIEEAVKKSPGLVFLAWGSPAGKRVDKIKPGPRHLVLRSVHPSPLSAHRGFFENGHFTKVNEWLYEKYGPDAVIDWALVKGNKLKKIEEFKLTPEELEKKREEERLEKEKEEEKKRLEEQKQQAERKRSEQARKEAEELLANSSDIDD